jgi:hypothetical protein
MKFIVGAIIVIGLTVGGWRLFDYWQGFKEKEPVAAAPEMTPSQLKGMVPQLEAILVEAQKRGASGLRDFLITYGHTIKDPRLAWIELDYVVLVARTDLGEARRVFAKVKQRTLKGSPIRDRVRQLEKAFE